MIAREWKARCPMAKKDDFIAYLYETGVKDSSATVGFQGAQIFTRQRPQASVEITLITYWRSLEAIVAFAGEDIAVAKLYAQDDRYELDPDHFVRHYEVVENQWC